MIHPSWPGVRGDISGTMICFLLGCRRPGRLHRSNLPFGDLGLILLLPVYQLLPHFFPVQFRGSERQIDVLGAHLEIKGSRHLVTPLLHLPLSSAQLHRPLLPGRQSFYLGHSHLLVMTGELTFAASTGSITPLYCSGPKFFSSVFGGWIGLNNSLLVSLKSSHHYCVPSASDKDMGNGVRRVK